MGDSDSVKRFYIYTPTEITKLAVKGAKEVDGLIIVSAKFVVPRQLKSGNLSLSLRTMKEAEILGFIVNRDRICIDEL